MAHPRWPALERRVSRHKTASWYVRVGHGPRVRLNSEPGTPEFRTEYEAAYSALLKGEKPSKAKAKGPSAGTMAWAWGQYLNSSAWEGLKPSTRRQRENLMKQVLEGAGTMPIERVTKQVVFAGRERRAKTPSQANNYLNMLRSFFDWAIDAGHLKTENPCADVKNVQRPKTRGFPEWTEEDVAKFEAHWPLGSRQRLAFAVHLHTGLRRGDAVRLGRQHFKKGAIHIKAEKNGADLTIPVHPGLVAAVQACPPSGLHILESSYGKQWGSKESYGNTFHEWALAAGVVDEGQPKNSHGLRKCAATRVAEAGASELEMMALFGWTDPAMARVYTKSANGKRLALQAASKVAGYAPMVIELFADTPSIEDGVVPVE